MVVDLVVKRECGRLSGNIIEHSIHRTMHTTVTAKEKCMLD